MNISEFDFEKAAISVKRVRINPCAQDEYAVIVSPKSGKEAIEVETFGGIFETDKAIAERVYNDIDFLN